MNQHVINILTANKGRWMGETEVVRAAYPGQRDSQISDVEWQGVIESLRAAGAQSKNIGRNTFVWRLPNTAEAIEAMTTAQFTAAAQRLGIRKNNTLIVGAFTVEKWGADRFQLRNGEQVLSVAPLAHITKRLIDNGAVTA